LSLIPNHYSGALLHTSKVGTIYNIYTPPSVSNGDWTIGSPYYSFLFLSEALRDVNNDGSVTVEDLGLQIHSSSHVAGYAVYDAADKSAQRLVLINYGDRSSTTQSMANVTFHVPCKLAKGGTVTTKYLTAPSVTEQTKITWGGQGADGQGRLLVQSTSPQEKLVSCSSSGVFEVDVPGPGVALVALCTS